ncbi:MAG: hypothetical protein V4539_16220 [Bacteroidota bacterium]
MKTNKLLIVAAFVAIATGASAQSIDPVSLIIAKVIKAIDLKVQKLQNETIWLQQAQSLADNELSKTKLSEITGWQQQLKDLYGGYFAELKNVKSSITGMSQIKRIVEMQQQVVTEYGRMAKDATVKPTYDAMLNTSMDVLQTLYAVTSSQYSMKDAERICMITTLKDAMSHCLANIQILNKQELELIGNRTRCQADLQYVKKLNGIQ